MTDPSTPEDLPPAIRAVSMGILSQETLDRAIQIWQEDRSRSLGEILIETTAITSEQLEEIRQQIDNDSRQETLLSDSGDEEEFEESLFDDAFLGKARNALKLVDEESSNEQENSHSNSAAISESVDADRFELRGLHAHGGLGEVHRAHDRQLNREVAVKQIREKWASSSDAAQRFHQEAEVTGRLEHPGVVPVYALGRRMDGRDYYAMRFIRGESLLEALEAYHDQYPQSSPEQALELRKLLGRFVDVCNTIGYAHSRGIIHRDLKPANIMLGKYGETLVVDWGLAKHVGTDDPETRELVESLITPISGSGSAPTQHGSAVGTPQYMSPEQATGQVDQIGPSSDIYCLGTTLFHVLAGQPPQPNDSLELMLYRVASGQYQKPRSIRHDVPQPLQAICLKAMSTQQSDRYASATDLAQDVEAWLGDAPVVAYREPLIGKVARWVRQHRLIVTSLGITLALLLIGSIIANSYLGHFQREQLAKDAEIARQEQERLVELRLSTESSLSLALEEITAGRFEPARKVMRRALASLEDEPEMDAERTLLEERLERVIRVIDFYDLIEQGEIANILDQHDKALLATQTALDRIGVWDQGNWWEALPTEDLTAEQKDELERYAYRALVQFASMYTRRFGEKMIRGDARSFFQRIRMALTGDAGVPEAEATTTICEMALRYQPAEAVRWFHGIARTRLKQRGRVSPRRLGIPYNSPDAYALGTLCLITGVDENFVFRGYRGNDNPLMMAKETLDIGTAYDPFHYWTYLRKGHVEFMLAERAKKAGDPEAWRLYESAMKSVSHCIVLRPDLPMAYADISTSALRQAEAMELSESLTVDDRERRQQDLIKFSLRDAEKARNLAPTVHWTYWHLGQSLQAIGRIDDAVDAYLTAVIGERQFASDSDTHLVDVDDFRGRRRCIDFARDLCDREQPNPRHKLLLAAGLFSAQQYDEAEQVVDELLLLPNASGFSYSLKGTLQFERGDFLEASASFERARQADAQDLWGVFGLAQILESGEHYEQALAAFQDAAEIAKTDEHQASALLGQAYSLLHLEREAEAIEAIQAAKRLHLSVSLDRIFEKAEELTAGAIIAAINDLPRIRPEMISENPSLKQFESPPIRNPGFELGFSGSWANENALTWENVNEFDSTAKISSSFVHSGQNSLEIFGERNPSGTGYGTIAQTIPVEPEKPYRLHVWARADDVQQGTLRLLINENWESPALILPGGTYDWKKFAVDIPAVTNTESPYDVTAPLRLRIVCAGEGHVWLDDFSIELRSETNQSNEKSVGPNSPTR